MVAQSKPGPEVQTRERWITAGLTLVFLVMALIVGEMSLSGPVFAQIKDLLPSQLAWQFSRATALVGYLLLTFSMGWGLILSTKISKEVTPPPVVMSLHNAISWAALGLAGLHALALLLDSYFTYTLLDLLVPFTGPYKPLAVGLGVLGFYVLLVTTISFAWRSWIGQKNWKRIHMLSFPMFAMITVHGFAAGSDSSQPALRLIYLASVVAILFLVNYRLMAAGRQRSSGGA